MCFYFKRKLWIKYHCTIFASVLGCRFSPCSAHSASPSPSLTTLPPLALHALQCKRPQGSISQCHKRSPSVCCWLPLDGGEGGGLSDEGQEQGQERAMVVVVLLLCFLRCGVCSSFGLQSASVVAIAWSTWRTIYTRTVGWPKYLKWFYFSYHQGVIDYRNSFPFDALIKSEGLKSMWIEAENKCKRVIWYP